VNPVIIIIIIIIIFYLFFAYTLCRVSIKNSTAATVIGLAKRVYVQSALKTRRYLCVYVYSYIILNTSDVGMCSHSPSLHRRLRIYIIYYIV
jgi:uncharacterized membrane protein (DUF106 family)